MSDIGLEEVDPNTFGAAAARLLTQAWEPPSMDYSPAYVQWQLRSPGTPAPRAVAAFDDREPVGFVAVLPRRMRAGTRVLRALVLTFVAVAPSHRGRGLAGRLYDRILAATAGQADAFIAFGAPETAGDRAVVAGFKRAGFDVRALAPCAAFSRARRTEAAQEVGVLDATGAAQALETWTGNEVLWSVPDEAGVTHLSSDPRGRLWLRAGDTSALASATRISVRTADGGLTVIPALDAVWTDLEQGDHLEAFADDVRHRWAPAGGLVVAPNLSFLTPEARRRAGFRQTSRGWIPYLCVLPARMLIEGIASTNLEVI